MTNTEFGFVFGSVCAVIWVVFCLFLINYQTKYLAYTAKPYMYYLKIEAFGIFRQCIYFIVCMTFIGWLWS